MERGHGREFVSLDEAASLLGVHYMTVYRYVRLGRLAAVKDGGRWKIPAAALEREVAGADDKSPGRRGSPRVDRHRERLLDRLLAGDQAGAWAVVEAALVAGLAPADVHLALLAPALREVGERWARGDASVAEEHRGTAVAGRLVGRLGPSFVRRGRRRGGVLVGCPPGDVHALPGAMLADLLRAERYEVVELGGDVPVESFVAAALDLDRLVAVCVSVGTGGREPVVAGVVDALHAVVDVPVLVGGPAMADEAHVASVGGDGWAADSIGVASILDDRSTAMRRRR